MDRWDVIVIGGGPAGSTTAGLLAKTGKKVLVLERAAFPRFHVGESLIPYGNPVLHELGVWDRLVAEGYTEKLGAEFVLSNSAGMRRFWFRDNLDEVYAKTFQVERARFDQMLLNQASTHGATVWEETKVVSVNVESKKIEVVCDKGGEEVRLETRWLLDASGRQAILGQRLGIKKSDLGLPKKLAVFSHFKGVYRNPGEASGHITIVRLERGWFWIIPLNAEKTSVGLVQTIEDIKKQGVTPEESYENTVKNHREIAFRMKEAERVEAYHIEADYTFRHERAAGERWLMVGDAAGFIDPIFSSGVMVALRSAQKAVQYVLKAETKGQGLTPKEQVAYTREVKRMTNVFLEMIKMFYDRSAFEVFMAPGKILDLQRAVLNLVAGNTEMSWSLQWRVWVFYRLCRLQRWVGIVPRLKFD